jgi:hypothetical protein
MIGWVVVVVEEVVVVEGGAVVVVDVVVTVVSATLGEHEAAMRPVSTKLVRVRKARCMVDDRTTDVELCRGSSALAGLDGVWRPGNRDPLG